MKRYITIAAIVALIALWLGLAFHYYFLLRDYASHGYHIEYPMLYIAIESWFLLCLVMVTAIALITATKFICPSST